MAEMKDTFFDMAEGDEFKNLISIGDARRKKGSKFVESVTKFINLMGDNHMSSARFAVAMEEAATTSDFPILLGTMLDQTMEAAYKAQPNDYRTYMRIGTQRDFRKSQMVKILGLEKPLPRVAQHGEYKEEQQSEGGMYIQLLKYGKKFSLTWEDIINDRLSAFSDSGTKLSRAAYKTEYRQATTLYAAANPTLFGAAVVNPFDKGKVNNLVNLPFNADNLATVIGMLRNQVDAFGEPIFFENVHLVVPPALEFTMWKVLNPAGLIVSGGDSTAGAKAQTQTSANVLTNYNIKPHVNPYLPIIDQTSGNKSWYVFIDPSDTPAIQFNFLTGHETPEVHMKASNLQGTDGGAAGAMNGSFENDTLEWRVRHVMGGVQIDPRGAVASQVPN